MKLLSWACLLIQLVMEIRCQNWREFEGHCYTIMDVRSNFETSKTTCQEYGSQIVEVEEELELEFIRILIGPREDQYWVGLDYNNVTQRYSWIRDGHESLTSFWLPNEPNYSGQCVRLARESQVGSSAGGTYKLGDQYCTTSCKVICEKNADLHEIVNYRDIVVPAETHCPMVTYPSRSKLSCAHNCARNKLCVGFQYNERFYSCTPYKFDVACTTPQISPLSMYVMEYARC